MQMMIGLALVAAQVSGGPTIDLPGWLAGTWVAKGPSGKWTEEWWSTPRAGIMLGASRTGVGERLDFFEHARIVRTASGVEFCALPQGRSGACFPAVSASDAEVVFEKVGHDYPTRIVYRRVKTGITAEISGPGGSRRQTWMMVPLKN